MSASVPFVDLSIVVPAYNEEHRLAPTLARLSAFLSTLPMRSEIVVVDVGGAAQLSTTTAKKDVYAFYFDQKGLMAGAGIQGSKISKIAK